MTTTTEQNAEAKFEKLIHHLPDTEISCWGIGQSGTNFRRGHGRHYYGVIEKVDNENPLKLRIKNGNIVEVWLHFRPGDHVVTLREATEGNTMDFTTHIECGFDFNKMKPIMLLDFMSQILDS